MPDKLVKDFTPLTVPEEATAIMAVIPNLGAGDTHKQTIAENAATLDRLSPFPAFTERVPLVTYTGADAANRALQSAPNSTMPNSLGFREKRVRHTFDSYQSVMFVVNLTSATSRTEFVNSAEWNASTEGDPVELRDGFEVWKVSETAFGFKGSQTTAKFLAGVYGYGAVLKTPEAFDASLRFEQSINNFTLVSGRSSTIQLPDAVGGTPPYTYSLEGTALPSSLVYYPEDLQIRGSLTGNVSGITWKVTDDAGEMYSEDFNIRTHSTLSLGGVSGSYSLPENTAPGNGSVTLPTATGGQQPYEYTFIPNSDVYTTTNGLEGRITVSRSGSTAHFVVSGDGNAPRAGESISVGFTWRVRDALGQTTETVYSVSQSNYGG